MNPWLDTLPKWGERFLKVIVPERLFEEIEGDLIEKFNTDTKVIGMHAARARLFYNILRYLRAGILLRKTFTINVNPAAMFLINLRFATRIAMRQKFFSVLNIVSLALGLGVSIVLLLVLKKDLTYDEHHLQNERIFRLGAHQQMAGDDFKGAITARELGPMLKGEFPEIERFVRVQAWGRALVKIPTSRGSEDFYEEKIIRADAEFFQVFTHAFLVGNPVNCLSPPKSVVVTRSAAEKYFGGITFDQSIIIDDEEYRVSGVIDDVPENSHLKFDFIVAGIPERTWFTEPSEAFWNPDVYTYLLMKHGYNINDFYEKFPAIYNKYLKVTGDQIGGRYTPILEPLTDIHFHSDLAADLPKGSISYLYATVIIGALIVLLACINYINLSTVRAARRAKEIAIKKVVGSERKSLVVYFLTESIFYGLIALCVAVVTLLLISRLPAVTGMFGRDLISQVLLDPSVVCWTIVLGLAISVIAGIYPSMILSATPVLKALRGSVNINAKHGIRKSLTGLQFCISILTVSLVLFMFQQIDFLSKKDLGFENENVLVVPLYDTAMQRQISSLRNQINALPGVTSVTASQNVIGDPSTLSNWGMWAETPEGMKIQGFNIFFVDESYLSTMGIKLLSGRDFLPEETFKKNRNFLANQAAIELMGWKKNPLGRRIRFYQDTVDANVIGVVKDFNFTSLHDPVAPALICKVSEENSFLQLRVKGDIQKTISKMQTLFHQYSSRYPFEYSLLDQKIEQQYRSDKIQAQTIGLLSIISVVLALSGLLGMTAHASEYRKKEMSIRKVLGARASHVLYLFSKELIVLMILALVISIPVALWLTDSWLSNFAYRMPISFVSIAAIASSSIGIVLIVTSLQSLRTAIENPSKILKCE